MNANPMEEQIGRLVGNLLAGGGEIFLPGVGSLYTERQGARRLNRRTVLPPSRTVAFTSQQRGVSLVDEIARVMREAGGYENPEAEAQAVYDRWIARVHRADLLTVEGVGELKFKNFIPDEAFDLRLNPQGREPVRVRVQRRFDNYISKLFPPAYGFVEDHSNEVLPQKAPLHAHPRHHLKLQYLYIRIILFPKHSSQPFL